MNEPVVEFCDKCGKVSEGVDFCPFDKEILDEETECNCCPDCVQECVWDI